MVSRRQLLALLPAAVASARLHAQIGIFRRKPKAPLAPSLVYFGTDTNKAGAKGLYMARFDAGKGQFSPPALAAACLRPAYMALNAVAVPASPRSPAHRLMYVCNEGDPKSSAISTYQLDPATGALTLLGSVSSGGEGPCYIAVEAGGSSAYVANYGGGSVASYTVKPDGTLTEPVDRVDFHNQEVFGQQGPVKDRQNGPHPHSSMLTPDNRFLVVNDLGNDDIATFPIDAKTARLGKPRFFRNLPPGSGPRHLAFHPNQRWAYGIDELANRLDQYLYTATHAGPGLEPEAMLSSANHSVSTVDANFHGANTAAEVIIDPPGNFLYASNRGEDSLAVFAIEQTAGALSFVQRIACGGKTPRHFTLDRTGDWLICGNQDSASVTVFARNPANGKLTGPVQTVPLESPMFTLFV